MRNAKIKNKKSKLWNCRRAAMTSLILHFAFWYLIFLLGSGCAPAVLDSSTFNVQFGRREDTGVNRQSLIDNELSQR